MNNRYYPWKKDRLLKKRIKIISGLGIKSGVRKLNPIIKKYIYIKLAINTKMARCLK